MTRQQFRLLMVLAVFSGLLGGAASGLLFRAAPERPPPAHAGAGTGSPPPSAWRPASSGSAQLTT